MMAQRISGTLETHPWLVAELSEGIVGYAQLERIVSKEHPIDACEMPLDFVNRPRSRPYVKVLKAQ